MQKWSKTEKQTQRISFLLFDQFSNLALANLLEPLRAANALLGYAAYTWQICTPGDRTVQSSSGLPVMPTTPLGEIGRGDILYVVAGYDHQTHARPATAKMLRALAGHFQVMAGIDTGSWLLGAAGLLDGRRATVHFDRTEAFAERFTSINVQRARWVRDGGRITCSGGMAAFDLACELIGEDHGTALLLELTQLFMSDGSHATQAPPQIRSDRRVDLCLRMMAAQIENPLTIAELARKVDCRQRDLELRFNKHFGATPRQVYKRLRLNAAKRMLIADGLSIAEVGLRVGYADASAFARAFRQEFGCNPRDVARGIALQNSGETPMTGP
ncbi:GlxA family transcriptional regulator [uncultured Aliiroseovarius sp.]|uniref:GlxA family transcriptional regulator n=1 Tax=uncultured Aliiroseovarius sp. TaxID=1658783 RepID=UPI0026307D6C|nr:GlxA family transcriptional regulator [uncultured Aliiroseovarius sp.]